ncbi:hypothetical protein ABZ926_21635 [Streptomyces litmocidini]|uniref:hypothetical protein n=1 Tax=Streptomyces litmocidini TaxID=67318 RepID=UPI0033F1618D
MDEQELWSQPALLSSRDWWYRLPEYEALHRVIQDHELLRTRVDTMVGSPSSLVARRLDIVVLQYLLTPVIEAVRAYRLDDDAFESAYAAVEAGLFAENVRLVEYVPLLGFDMSHSLAGVGLPDGLVVRPMSDVELSEAVRVMGIPIGQFTSTNSLMLSRLHQNALVLERDLPVHSGYEQHPDAGAPSPFDAASSRMLLALRIVCGGSVTYGRPMAMQSQDDFDPQRYASSMLTEVQHPAEGRPTLLVEAAKVQELHKVYGLLGEPQIQNQRFLRNALHRLVMAGARAHAEDRLIDLCITAESLFIHHSGLPREHGKQKHLIDGAKSLLAGDPVFSAEGDYIEELISCAYRRRNTEVHGDVAGPGAFRRLDGTTTSDLHALVDDLERIMRRAAHLFLVRAAAPEDSSLDFSAEPLPDPC